VEAEMCPLSALTFYHMMVQILTGRSPWHHKDSHISPYQCCNYHSNGNSLP